jgi:jasmonate O-methyltransferase
MSRYICVSEKYYGSEGVIVNIPIITPDPLQGRVEKEKLDSFNMPLYAPSLNEVKAVLDRTELFAIEHMGLVEFNWDPQDDNLDDHMICDPASSGTNVAKAIRAVLEPLIAGHFGEDIIDELFAIYASIVAKYLEEAGNAKCCSIVVSLKKAMH